MEARRMKNAKALVLIVSSLAILAGAAVMMADESEAMGGTVTFDEGYGTKYAITPTDATLTIDPVSRTVIVPSGVKFDFTLKPSFGYALGSAYILKSNGTAVDPVLPITDGERKYSLAADMNHAVTVEGMAPLEMVKVSLDAGSAARCTLSPMMGNEYNPIGMPFPFKISVKDAYYPGTLKVEYVQGTDAAVTLTPDAEGIYGIPKTDAPCTVTVSGVLPKTVIGLPEASPDYELKVNGTHFVPGVPVEISVKPAAGYGGLPTVRVGGVAVAVTPFEGGYQGTCPAPAADATIAVELKATEIDLIFNFNGGEVKGADGTPITEADLNKTKLGAGTAISMPQSTPVKVGYVFKYWELQNGKTVLLMPGDTYTIKAHWMYSGSAIESKVLVSAKFSKVYSVAFDAGTDPVYLQPISSDKLIAEADTEFRFKLAVRPGYAVAAELNEDTYTDYGNNVYGALAPLDALEMKIVFKSITVSKLGSCVDFSDPDPVQIQENMGKLDGLLKAGKMPFIVIMKGTELPGDFFFFATLMPKGTELVVYGTDNIPMYSLSLLDSGKYDMVRDYGFMKYGYSVVDHEADIYLKTALMNVKASKSYVVDFEMSGDAPFGVGVGCYVHSAFAPGKVVDVYRYDPAEKTMEIVAKSVVVDADGMAHFETDHFSTFAIIEPEPHPAPVNGSGDNTVLYAAIGAAAVWVCVGAIVLLRRR